MWMKQGIRIEAYGVLLSPRTLWGKRRDVCEKLILKLFLNKTRKSVRRYYVLCLGAAKRGFRLQAYNNYIHISCTARKNRT